MYPHEQRFHRSPWTSEQLNSLAVWYASVSTTAGKLASIAGVNDERRPIVLRSLERCSRVRPLCIFRASTGEYDIGSFMLFDYIYFRSHKLKAFSTPQSKYLSNDEVEKSEDGVTMLLLLLLLLPLGECMLSQFMLKSVPSDILKIALLIYL